MEDQNIIGFIRRDSSDLINYPVWKISKDENVDNKQCEGSLYNNNPSRVTHKTKLNFKDPKTEPFTREEDYSYLCEECTHFILTHYNPISIKKYGFDSIKYGKSI